MYILYMIIVVKIWIDLYVASKLALILHHLRYLLGQGDLRGLSFNSGLATALEIILLVEAGSVHALGLSKL